MKDMTEEKYSHVQLEKLKLIAKEVIPDNMGSVMLYRNQ